VLSFQVFGVAEVYAYFGGLSGRQSGYVGSPDATSSVGVVYKHVEASGNSCGYQLGKQFGFFPAEMIEVEVLVSDYRTGGVVYHGAVVDAQVVSFVAFVDFRAQGFYVRA